MLINCRWFCAANGCSALSMDGNYIGADIACCLCNDGGFCCYEESFSRCICDPCPCCGCDSACDARVIENLCRRLRTGETTTRFDSVARATLVSIALV